MIPDNQSTAEIIRSIRSAFGGEDPTKSRLVARAQILGWMRSSDIEVRGALYSKITNTECIKHIEPPLQFDDYFDFVIPYLEQCIEQDPDGDWSDSRYLAGHALVGWIKDFWNRKNEVPREKIAEIKDRLANLYRRGDGGVRDGLINGVLEHLFENRELARYFKDWERDPVLAHAYSEASLWTEGKAGDPDVDR